jgi:hypothetical protein
MVTSLRDVDPAKADRVAELLRERPINVTELQNVLESVPGANDPKNRDLINNTRDRAHITNAVNDLGQSVAAGASSQEIRERTRAVQQALDTANANGTIKAGAGAADRLRKMHDQLALLSRVRERIAAATGAAGMPQGVCLLVYWPDLAAGQRVVVCEDAVVIGTGGEGSLGVAEGPPQADAAGSDPGMGDAADNGQQMTIVVDNAGNQHDFSFLSNGRTITVNAGEAMKYKGRGPITVTFDQGGGGEPASRQLTAGVYRVGVTREGTLDLFAVPAGGGAQAPGDN